MNTKANITRDRASAETAVPGVVSAPDGYPRQKELKFANLICRITPHVDSSGASLRIELRASKDNPHSLVLSGASERETAFADLQQEFALFKGADENHKSKTVEADAVKGFVRRLRKVGVTFDRPRDVYRRGSFLDAFDRYEMEVCRLATEPVQKTIYRVQKVSVNKLLEESVLQADDLANEVPGGAVDHVSWITVSSGKDRETLQILRKAFHFPYSLYRDLTREDRSAIATHYRQGFACTDLHVFSHDPDNPLEIEKTEITCIMFGNTLLTLTDGSAEAECVLKKLREEIQEDVKDNGIDIDKRGVIAPYDLLMDEVVHRNQRTQKDLVRYLEDVRLRYNRRDISVKEVEKIACAADEIISQMDLEIAGLEEAFSTAGGFLSEYRMGKLSNGDAEKIYDSMAKDQERDAFFRRQSRIRRCEKGMLRLKDRVLKLEKEVEKHHNWLKVLNESRIARAGLAIAGIGGLLAVPQFVARYGLSDSLITAGEVGCALLLAWSLVGPTVSSWLSVRRTRKNGFF